MAVAVIFPGQGTQGAGMGAPWRDHPAWGVVERAEAALGEPLAPLLLAESADELARTRESQLAVLLTSLVAWEAARSEAAGPGRVRRPLPRPDHRPDRLGRPPPRRRHPAGRPPGRGHPGRRRPPPGPHGRRARRRRGPGAEACDAAPRRMLAGQRQRPRPGRDRRHPVRASSGPPRPRPGLGIRRVMPLKVGGAFHTPLMAEAAAAAGPGAGRRSRFPTPAAPIVSNERRPSLRRRRRLAAAAERHLVSPVRWRGCMATLVDELGATTLVEVGFGSMLAGLAKRCAPGVPVLGVATPDDIAPLSEVRP